MSDLSDISDPDPDMDAAAAAEFAALTTDAGRRVLALAAEVDRPGPADLQRWRRLADPDLVAAASRLVEARRRGRAKFARADRMWLSARGLEQATAEAVARHKAARFASDGGPDEVVVDLCSGIGGDALAIARSIGVIAVDLDPAMTARARWNAEAYDVAVRTVAARAEDFAIPPESLIHVDPDRRATSARKANAVAEYAPGLDFLLGLTGRARGGGIKLGPASDFAAHFGGPGFEVELVSLRGECKEATAWFGDRASADGARRRATGLPSGATWTNRDDPDPAAPPVAAGPLGPWVYDPDPALVRAGLVDGFARAHGWARVEPGADLLTGPGPSPSPLAASFAVVAEFPLDVKALRREVAARGLGPLEIKTRGLDIAPEAYRARLRPAGPVPATWILLAGRGGPGRAILARRP